MSLVKLSKAKVKLVQGGIYDDDILCATCDRKIGELDDYMLNFVKKFHTAQRSIAPYFFVSGFEADTLIRFAASIIWRCSISSRPETRVINLEKKTDIFRDIVFNEPTTSIAYPKAIFMRYTSSILDDVEHFCVFPSQTKVVTAPSDSSFYAVMLGGFRIVLRIDSDEWPPNTPPTPINGSKEISGVFLNLDTSPEFAGLLNHLLAQGLHVKKPR